MSASDRNMDHTARPLSRDGLVLITYGPIKAIRHFPTSGTPIHCGAGMHSFLAALPGTRGIHTIGWFCPCGAVFIRADLIGKEREEQEPEE